VEGRPGTTLKSRLYLTRTAVVLRGTGKDIGTDWVGINQKSKQVSKNPEAKEKRAR